MNKNLYPRTMDYSGAAYFGFLSLFTFYEMTFEDGLISPIVYAPIVSILFTQILLWLVLWLFYFLLGPDRQSDQPEQTLQIPRFYLTAILVVASAPVILAILDWTDIPLIHAATMRSILQDPAFWFFVIFTASEVFFRSFLFSSVKGTIREKFIDRVDHLERSYPTGSQLLVVLGLGWFLILILIAPYVEGIIYWDALATSLYAIVFFIILRALYKLFFKDFEETQFSEIIMPEQTLGGLRQRIWPTARSLFRWLAPVLAVIFAMLSNYFVSSFAQTSSPRRSSEWSCSLFPSTMP